MRASRSISFALGRLPAHRNRVRLMDHNAAPLADRVVQTAYFAVTGRALSRSLLPFETVAAPTIVAATSWTAIDHA